MKDDSDEFEDSKRGGKPFDRCATSNISSLSNLSNLVTETFIESFTESVRQSIGKGYLLKGGS